MGRRDLRRHSQHLQQPVRRGNPTVNSWLQNGDAYAKATRDFVVSLPEPTRSQVSEVFTRSLSSIPLVLYRTGSKAAESTEDRV